MNYFALMAILPKLLEVGDDVKSCLDGECTAAEVQELVDDLWKIAETFPELKGFLVMTAPLIDAMRKVLPDLMAGYRRHTIPESEIVKIEASVKMLGPLVKKVEAEAMANPTAASSKPE